MAKVTIDESLCTGCGLCETSCPEVFKVGDDNIAHVISQKCDTCNLEQVAEECPLEAIKIEG